MKRVRLLRHLRKQGCVLLREGGPHSIWLNPETGALSAVPRHSEIKDLMAKKICRDLDIEQA
ncbi:MAG: addiction module toxin, HicA family [Gammaproteobacteria bacterium]|jgi:mRNA interferase HicA|nr:addiction module toxin, HicA family [Gammaproteobacteria bacterium]